VAEELPALSRQALVTEAEAIWRDGNVRLQWLPGDARVDPRSTLRALVIPRPAAAAVEGSTRWAVGELVRFEGPSAIAIASIAGAQRVVEESERFQLIESPIGRDQRLGVILGRALAHEIGHYVLQTNTHAPYGLMRANIDAYEFADPRLGPFRLDREAKAHLAARAAMGPHRFIPAATSGFSYSNR
jgi:hypothetical protein